MNNTHLALLNFPRGKMIAERDGDVLVGLWFAGQPLAPSESSFFDDATSVPLWVQLQSELDEYFAGEREVFTVAYELRGTQWQKSVWSELEKIPAGQTVTYGEIAAALHNEGASRAVGTAVGRNPVSIIVPCHRVLPTSGGIGNYGGGVENKAALLMLEGAVE
ncbi:methylated-DNA--[protein]-cysteine S-methyltransferase [Corynebacterium dentalis]|uniref:methylated-DNA--[protein]-cysteine S-methyltransferase n=1 Tax=Corynebacterium dentalis TaxID=2014528 RepID=UPI00289F6EB2|nr:methylated-DNA--[protein]-cysteine S-methyltransferase [Corynebacterium dentalis]